MIKVLQERPSVSIPCYHHIQITSQLFLCTIFFFFLLQSVLKYLTSSESGRHAAPATSYLNNPQSGGPQCEHCEAPLLKTGAYDCQGQQGWGGVSSSSSKPWIWWYISKPLIYFMSMLVRVHLNTHLFRVPQCQQPFPTRAGSLASQRPGSAEGFYNSREDYRVKECARSRPRWPNGQSQVLGVKKK